MADDNPLANPSRFETETLDKLFLELSQFTNAQTATEWRAQEFFGRATITHRRGTGELAPTISLLFETDTDADAAYDVLMKLREGKRS